MPRVFNCGQVAVGRELRVEDQVGRGLPGLARPEAHEGQDLVGLVALAQVGVAVAQHPRVAVLGQEGQHALLPPTAPRDVVLFDELVGPEERDRVEIEVERLPGQDLVLAQRPDPAVQQGAQAPGPQPTRVLAEQRGLGQHVEAGPQGQPVVEDEVHDVALAFGAGQLERQRGAHRVRGRDHPGPREARGLHQVVEPEPHQPGEEEEQAAHGGRKPARGATELPDVGDRRALGPRPRRPLLVAAPGQASEAFGAQHLVNRGEAQRVALLAQRILDVVDRQVLLAQGDDHRAGGILLGLHLRARAGASAKKSRRWPWRKAWHSTRNAPGVYPKRRAASADGRPSAK